MHDAGFSLFGCQVFTDDVFLDKEDKLTAEQREAVTLAMTDLASRRLMAKTLIIAKFQVVAFTALDHDLVQGALSIADVRGAIFMGRQNRTSGE